MSSNIPSRDNLTTGMFVEIEQENGDRIVGEVGAILDDSEHPEGVLVKLDSGEQGRVKQIHPET